ncbi:MAG: heparinase II/III family protein [Pseudomonadota bacterium]
MPKAETGRQRFYHDIQLRGPVPGRLLHVPEIVSQPPTPLVEAATALSDDPNTLADCLAPYGLFDNFSWLPLLTAGDDVTRRQQGMIACWLERSGRYRPKAWATPITAERLHHSLASIRTTLAGRDAPWRETIFDTLVRQARHLRRAERGLRDEETTVRGAMARCLVALCFPDDKTLGRAETQGLRRGLGNLASGRIPVAWANPQSALRFALELANLRRAYRERALTPPPEILEAQKVVHLYLGGWTGAPGVFISFPHGQEGDPALIAALSPPQRQASAVLLATVGVYRMESDNVRLWVDGRSRGGAAGAFALYDGASPIIVNCGVPSPLGAALIPRLTSWREALKATAASSTLDAAIKGAVVAEWLEADAPSQMQGARVGKRDGARWHAREISLSSDGQEVEGVDETGGDVQEETYRFHLPPGAVVEHASDAEVRIIPPSLPDRCSAAAWRFSVKTEARMGEEESVFVSQDAVVEEGARQIVVRCGPGRSEWSLRRETG